MSERVSSEDVTAFINLATLHLYPSRDLEKETLPVEVKIAFDLLDARDRIREAAEIFTLVLEDVTYFPGPGMRRWLEAVGRRG